MNRYLKLVILIIVPVLMLQGCSVFKITNIEKASVNHSTLWIKKVDLFSCDKSQKIGKLDVRYVIDSVLVVIIRNNTGIEGVRVYIYKDSLWVFNRMNKKYFSDNIKEYNSNRQEKGNELTNIGRLLMQKNYKKTQARFASKKLQIDVWFQILKFKETDNKSYIPLESKSMIVLKNRRYCIYAVAGDIVKDRKVPVALIKYTGRYKQVNDINEII